VLVCSVFTISIFSLTETSSVSFLNHFMLDAGGFDKNLQQNSALEPSLTVIFSNFATIFGASKFKINIIYSIHY